MVRCGPAYQYVWTKKKQERRGEKEKGFERGGLAEGQARSKEEQRTRRMYHPEGKERGKRKGGGAEDGEDGGKTDEEEAEKEAGKQIRRTMHTEGKEGSSYQQRSD